MALHTDPQSVFEAAARQYTLCVTCTRCRRFKVYDPHALWYLFERRGWNDRLKAIARGRFRCTNCRCREVSIDLGRMVPTGPQPPMPEERHWKRRVNDYRG